MYSTQLLPLFAFGCVTVPNIQGEVDPEPTHDLADDVFDDDVLDDSADDASDDAHEPHDFDAMSASEVRMKIYGALNDLHALEVVQVGDVILDLPDEAICAYGWSPCPGFEDLVDEALREAAPRLDALVHHGQAAVAEDAEIGDGSCSDRIIDANLDALEDLEIVKVGDLLVEEPEQNCPYSLPCEEDIIAAEEITCERAASLDRLVDRTQQL
jgi:hypothetical protein